MRAPGFFLSVLLLCVGLQPAIAAKVGPQFTAGLRGSVRPSVASYPGGFVVVSQAMGGIFAKRFTSTGAALGSVRVSAYAARIHRDPAVASLGTNGYVVVWAAYRASDEFGVGIYGQRYATDGTPIGGNFRIDAPVGAAIPWVPRRPAVAGLAGGGFVAAWEDSRRPNVIYGQRFDAAGARAGGEIAISTAAFGVSDADLAIAGFSDGGFIVVWQGHEPGREAYHTIWGQRFTAAGARTGRETPVNSSTVTLEQDPSVAVLGDGGYVVTWQSIDMTNAIDRGIFAQRYSAAGARIGSAFKVNSSVSAFNLPRRRSAVAALADGGFAIVWHWYHAARVGGGYFVERQQYSASGAPVGVNAHVNTTVGVADSPAIAPLGSGFVVAWSLNDCSGCQPIVLGQRFDNLP